MGSGHKETGKWKEAQHAPVQGYKGDRRVNGKVALVVDLSIRIYPLRKPRIKKMC